MTMITEQKQSVTVQYMFLYSKNIEGRVSLQVLTGMTMTAGTYRWISILAARTHLWLRMKLDAEDWICMASRSLTLPALLLYAPPPAHSYCSSASPVLGSWVPAALPVFNQLLKYFLFSLFFYKTAFLLTQTWMQANAVTHPASLSGTRRSLLIWAIPF